MSGRQKLLTVRSRPESDEVRVASPHTCAVPLLRSQSKAAVAATLETPDGVPAISVGAETLEHFTLVHICRRIR